jgi:hypothetical protein
MTTLAELADDALTLVNKALALARRALAANPAPQDRTDLNQMILELEKKRAKLESELEALRRGPSVEAPGPTVVTQIKALTDEVGAAIRANATSRDAMALAGRVLATLQTSGV